MARDGSMVTKSIEAPASSSHASRHSETPHESAHEKLASFEDIARVPRRAAVAAMAALSSSSTKLGKFSSSKGGLKAQPEGAVSGAPPGKYVTPAAASGPKSAVKAGKAAVNGCSTGGASAATGRVTSSLTKAKTVRGAGAAVPSKSERNKSSSSNSTSAAAFSPKVKGKAENTKGIDRLDLAEETGKEEERSCPGDSLKKQKMTATAAGAAAAVSRGKGNVRKDQATPVSSRPSSVVASGRRRQSTGTSGRSSIGNKVGGTAAAASVSTTLPKKLGRLPPKKTGPSEKTSEVVGESNNGNGNGGGGAGSPVEKDEGKMSVGKAKANSGKLGRRSSIRNARGRANQCAGGKGNGGATNSNLEEGVGPMKRGHTEKQESAVKPKRERSRTRPGRGSVKPVKSPEPLSSIGRSRGSADTSRLGASMYPRRNR